MTATRAAAICFALAAALPLGLTTYQLSVATQILIFAILAMAIDILAGFAGRTSLGHGAIFGVATYVVVYAVAQAGISPYLAFALGVVAAGAGAAFFCLLALRPPGVYFFPLHPPP